MSDHEERALLTAILHSLYELHRKADCIMADLSALTDEIDALDQAEVNASAELSALAGSVKNLTDEVASLQAGAISQAQIDTLTTHATNIVSGLNAAIAAAAPPAAAPAPGDVPSGAPVADTPPAPASAPVEAPADAPPPTA